MLKRNPWRIVLDSFRQLDGTSGADDISTCQLAQPKHPVSGKACLDIDSRRWHSEPCESSPSAVVEMPIGLRLVGIAGMLCSQGRLPQTGFRQTRFVYEGDDEMGMSGDSRPL